MQNDEATGSQHVVHQAASHDRLENLLGHLDGFQ